MSKKNISDKKRIRIATEEIRNASVKGKFFQKKVDNKFIFVSQLRIASVENYPFVIEQFEKSIGKSILPKRNFRELLRNHLDFIDINTEYLWAKNIILKNSPEINSFLKLSSEYSSFLLKGDYAQALNQLDQIEMEFGNSIWLFKNKISFLQLSKGLEEQKEYTNNIKKKIPNGSLSKYLIHWVSIRNESQTTVSRFKIQIEQSLNNLSPIKQFGFKEYLKYHLYDSEITSSDDMIQVLRISYSSSIIDYYEAFISLLHTFVINQNVQNKGRAVNFLKTFCGEFNDNRLYVIKAGLGIDIDIQYADVFGIKYYDKLLSGAITEVCDAHILENEATSNLPANILVKAFAISFSDNVSSENLLQNDKNDNIYNFIVNSLSIILNKGIVEASKEYNELNKLALNFSDFSWSHIIKIVGCKENALLANFSPGCIVSVLKTGLVHPILLDCVDSDEVYNNFSKTINSVFTDNLSTLYNKSLKHLKYHEGIETLHPPFKSLLKGVCHYNSQKYSDSIRCGRNLASNAKGYFSRRGYGLISYSHVEEGRYADACISAAEFYLAEKNIYQFLPLNQIATTLKPGTKEWYEVNKNIELSIILDACQKHTNKNIENPRRFAYEDYLLSLRIEKPSQLKTKLEGIDLQKIIYYLRYICLENVMDTSGAFEGGSNEVISERLEICRLLSEIDSSHQDIYKQEINEIVRRQVITSRRQEIDQSRVHVDVKSIKEWAEMELEESFDRYITYLKTGLNKRPLKADGFKFDQVGSMNIPDDEVSELLKYMVNEIKKKYLSADMGLDRFISTRIRHGELERTMRIPIQKHNLITKKEVKNGPYSSNSFWIDKLNTSQENQNIVDKAFKRFSEDYDSLISKIANEWLQIKSAAKSVGLFDFRISDFELQRVANSINSSSTLEEFILLVIKILDNTLIVLLVNIREELNSRGKKEVKALLTKLYDEVDQGSLITLDLQRSIGQARTDLTAQFDKIIEWFVPSTEGNSAPYTIEDAILVADAIIKEGTPNFKINIDIEDEDIYSIHGQLPIFTDIFLNIFENVVKRSGLESPKANIEIKTNLIDEGYFVMNMKISNYLGNNIDTELLEKTLNRIKRLLSKGSYSEYLATERNSGLLKIHRSVSDFSVIGASIDPTMDFGFNNDRFVIEISVPFKIFILEQEEDN